jgi:hypothetical protein
MRLERHEDVDFFFLDASMGITLNKADPTFISFLFDTRSNDPSSD